MADVIASIRAGVSLNGVERTAATDEFAVLKTGAVLKERFDPTQYKVVSASATSRLRTPVTAGTIIICRKNSEEAVGGSVLIDKDFPNLYLSDLLWELRPSQGVDVRWLAYTLQSPEARARIRIASTGTQSTMKNISRDRLLGLAAVVPPLVEQRKIAEILRAWDDAIEGLQQLRKSQTARREAMISKLLFGGGHPHGTTWARTARDWTIRPIGDIAKEAGARNAGLSAEAVLTCSKHLGFVRSEDYFGRTVHSKDLSNYKLVHRDEFAFPSNHVEEGSIGLQNVVDTGAVSPIYTVFVFNRELIDPRFAYLVLKSQHYTHMFRVSTSATVDRRGSLRWPEFSRLPFPVPPMRMQERIVEVAKDFDDDLARTSTLIALYRDQKRVLMQKLLTGEIRVTGNVAASLRGASVV